MSASSSLPIALLLLAGVTSAPVCAQVVFAAPPTAPSDAAAAARLPKVEPPTFVHGATVRLLTGYTDNVLWSAIEKEGRGFAQAEVEAFLWRPARTTWEAKAMLSGEVRRYIDELPEAAGEQRWIARGELAVTLTRWLRLLAAPQAFYMDQVYDLSPDVGRRFVAKMKVKGASGAAHARFTLPRGWEIEPSVQERALDYYDFSEDFSETKTGVRLRWRSGARVEAGAAIYNHVRPYRERVNYTAGGRALPGTDLVFHQTSVEANIGCTWESRGQWRLGTAYLHLENRDRASGFFNYDQERVRCDLSWERKRWRIESELSAGRYDYLTQTVGMGLVPPARVRENFAASLAIEYTLAGRWKNIMRYGWERSRTNEVHSSYRINTASFGVAWNY